jgi:hypothetical protein
MKRRRPLAIYREIDSQNRSWPTIGFRTNANHQWGELNDTDLARCANRLFKSRRPQRVAKLRRPLRRDLGGRLPDHPNNSSARAWEAYLP